MYFPQSPYITPEALNTLGANIAQRCVTSVDRLVIRFYSRFAGPRLSLEAMAWR